MLFRSILVEIEAGVRKTGMKKFENVLSQRGYAMEVDRRAAIHAALSWARAGDAVLIAGKGHEDYQILGAEKIHFDDREVARAEILARAGV